MFRIICKIYFFDIGIRNAVLGNFLPLKNREDNGSLFENFIFLELKNRYKNLFFYRSLAKTEIDFIVEKNNQLILIEAKYRNLKEELDERTLKHFKEKIIQVKGIFVANLSFNKESNLVSYLDYRFLNII